MVATARTSAMPQTKTCAASSAATRASCATKKRSSCAKSRQSSARLQRLYCVGVLESASLRASVATQATRLHQQLLHRLRLLLHHQQRRSRRQSRALSTAHCHRSYSQTCSRKDSRRRRQCRCKCCRASSHARTYVRQLRVCDSRRSALRAQVHHHRTDLQCDCSCS